MKYLLTYEAIDKNITPLSRPVDGDAGYDLRSVYNVELEPNSLKKIKTGVHLAIPLGYVGIIKDRSSLALQHISVHGGVIDSTYRGEILVILENRGNEIFQIATNQKIAQMLIIPYANFELDLVKRNEDLGNTDRGDAGFGSTGKY